MTTIKAFGMIALALVGVATPALAYTTAHPHTHMYWLPGTHEQDASAGGATVEGYSSLKGLCYDVEPVVRGTLLPPPSPGQDGDEDWGIGGACFSYVSPYGSDAGKTVTVFAAENLFAARSAEWVACVDVDGDGLCTDDGVDVYVNCDTGGAASGSRNADVGSGPCTVTLVPAADPTLYVLMATRVTTGGAQLSGYGTVWING